MSPDAPNPETEAASQDGLDLELLGVLESYLAGVEQGEHADPETIIAAHPDIAERLRGCLASLRFLGGTSEAFRPDLVTDHEDSAHSRTAAKRLGDYCILREIGRGGMGVVYEAEQVSLGRRVALKVLPFAAALDARQIARFKNEAHAAAQLHHTNIVPVFAVGCDQGVYYYAMQLIEGQSLSQVIRELRESSGLPADEARAATAVPSVSRSLSAGDFAPPERAPRAAPAKNGASTEKSSSTHLTASSERGSTRRAVFFRSVARIWLQAAEALEHAHALGIVHRDLKPGNFLLDVRGTLWVADFGLARCQSDASITVSGDVLGTLRYMSPEQALARPGAVDHRSDIYSLGATIYELLTLEPAVAGADRQEISRRIANDEPASPRRLNRSIPVDLETIVLESMSKEPDGRYRSARELADDLRRFLDDVPIHARRISLLGRTLRWAKRRRGLVSAVTTITLLGLFAAVLGYWRWSEARETAYREAIESAVGKIGLAGSVMNALELESSEGLRVSEYSLRHFRSEGMDGLLESVDEAIDELDLAERILPGRPEAPYHRARAHALVRRDAGARSSLERALAVDPDFAAALVAQSLLEDRMAPGSRAPSEAAVETSRAAIRSDYERVRLGIESAVARKAWREAAAGYGELRERAAKTGEPYVGAALEASLGRGLALMEAKDNLGALIELGGVKARWPLLVETDLLVGRALLGLGAVEKAQSCFLDAYERSRRQNAVAYAAMVLFELSYQTSTGTEISKSALFWAERLERADVRAGRRALHLYFLRDYDAAVAAGKEAIGANPRDGRTRVLLADALEHLGERDAAAAHIAALERLDSASSHTYGILSWYHGMRGAYAAATDAAMRAYELNPANLELLTLAARWSIYAGEHAKARDLLDRVLAKTPHSTSALDHLGQLLTDQRDFDGAIEVFERGFAIDPNNCAIANSYAWTLRRMGRLEDAESMCRRSIKFGWKNVLAHHNLVGILLERGEPHEAAIAAEAAIADVDPLDAKLHGAVGRAREGMEDFDGAAAAYARAVDTTVANQGEAELDRLADLVERDAITATAIATVVETIRRAVEGRQVSFPLLQLVDVLRAKGEGPDVSDLLPRARAQVAAGIERAAQRDGRSLELLAAIDFALGEHARAIRTLEEAQRLPDASGSIATQVEDYRRVALPDLPTYGSIDAALKQVDRAAVIADGAEWRFLRGTRTPLGEPIAWTRPDFDDSDWERGPSGFGYGDADDRTRLDDMRGNYTTLAIRKTWTLDDSARYRALVLSVRADDGFVAYLDGQEIGRERAGKPGDPPLPFDAVATTFAPEWPLATTEIPIDGAALGYGTHVLAIQVLNVSKASSDLSMIPVLEGELDPDPVRVRALLAAFRAVATGTNVAARVAYLEGRLAERMGDRERAAERFSESARLDPGAPEPRAAAASASAAQGPPSAAGR